MKTFKEFVNDIVNESKTDFENWFNGSKIIKNGKPLLVYHSNFKDEISPYNKKFIYFTDDSTFGKRYLGDNSIQHKAYLKITKPFVCTDKNLKELFTEYFPYNKEHWSKPWKCCNDPRVAVGSYGFGKYGYNNRISSMIDDFNSSEKFERELIYDKVIKKGYDGVIIPYDWDGGRGIIKSFVVFSMNQIWVVK